MWPGSTPVAGENLSAVACLLAACGLLVAPGYCLARLLTVPGAVFAALPLSAFVLFCGVVGMQGAGTRITFWPVAAWLAAVTAVCGWRLMLAGSQPEAGKMVSAGRLPRLVVGFACVVAAAVALRLALFPLSGFDTLSGKSASLRATAAATTHANPTTSRGSR
ncbi:hypothetical protein EBR56_00785, partial [bacterium]|nr:hypothetical protein [bacterium]